MKRGNDLHHTQRLLARAARTPLEPTIRHVNDFWTLRGPSGRDLTCSVYKVEGGRELRTEYNATELVASKLPTRKARELRGSGTLIGLFEREIYRKGWRP